jgi:hypothetical protein
MSSVSSENACSGYFISHFLLKENKKSDRKKERKKVTPIIFFVTLYWFTTTSFNLRGGQRAYTYMKVKC